MRIYVIAEAGVNHNGREDLALQLAETAARCGADAVKFQTFSAHKLVVPGADKAEYQKRETGSSDQFDMLKQLQMSDDMHRKVAMRCRALGIEFMSTPFDEEAVDYLLELGMRRIKIPSGEITNMLLLRHIAAKDFPMILSTGMADLQEVLDAVEVIRMERKRLGHQGELQQLLTLLHCTSNYPAEAKNVNLRAMQTMASAAGLPVGYSDHTSGTAVSVAAAALGATVIEKHFTLNRDLPGPDHKASLEPDQLAAMIAQIRIVECALGSNRKAPADSELPIRSLVRRSVTVARDLVKGHVLTRDDLVLLRPGTGIPPADLEKVIGRRTVRSICGPTTLQWGDIE